MIHHADDPDSPEPRPRRRRPRSRPPAAESEEAARGILLDGARIAEEFGRTPGWFLFLTHRTVELWALARPQDRGELFTVRSHAERLADLTLLSIDPAMQGPLSVLTDLLRDPVGTDAERVVEACRQVAAWSAGQGKLETALLFAEAATRVRPGSARLLYEAGKIARQAARWPAAEKWLGAAVEAGRKTRDWEWAAMALGGLGVMYRKNGNLGLARRYHLRSLSVARRAELRQIEGEAAHHLLVLAAESGDSDGVQQWAQVALACYPANHPSLAILAHDIAFFWLEQGRFRRALHVFQAVLPHVTDGSNRILVLASMARAAGGCGSHSDFERVSFDLSNLIQTAVVQENGADVLLDLARGAAGLLQWDLAEACATGAVEVAGQRRQGKVRLEAEALVESVRAERHAAALQKGGGETDHEEDLAAHLVALLATQAPLSG